MSHCERYRARALLVSACLALTLTSCSAEHPPEAPQAPVADDATARHMIQQANDAAWEQLHRIFPELERPEVEQRRVVSAAEWDAVHAQCVTEMGFSATVMAGGGVSYGQIPDEQAEAQNLAVYICQVRYPRDPSYLLPLTADEAAYVYDYYEDTLVPCLAARGHEVEMPSTSVFHERLKTEGVPWSPYQELHEVAGAELDTLLAECPQSPPGFRGGS